MAIVGFQLRLLCADKICAIRPSCPCRGQAKLGEDHQHTLTTLSNLALLLHAQGQLAEAEPLYREAIKKCRGAQLEGFQRDFGHTHSWDGFGILGEESSKTGFNWSLKKGMAKCLENSKVH